MAGHPGYLLPDGDAYTEELACCLVFYPDKPEYRRALLGSLVYLSTWLAWERDSEKRGKDAARAWKNAVDETLECWNMACLEELIADVATIRALMETKKDCCDENVTYFPTEEPTTEIVPWVGDAPDYYGETAVTDWDDWAEHVCYNAHNYVDYLKSTSYELMTAVNVGSIFLGLISSALVLLAFSGIGLPIAFGLAAAVVTGIALGATATTFSGTAAAFETARDEIVCAIVAGNSLAAAVEDALGSGTDWDLFYQFVDYDSAVAILYEGGYDTDYLPSQTRDDCVCEADARFVFTWPTDIDGFTAAALTILWVSGQYVTSTPSNTAQWKQEDFWPWDDLATRFSFSLPVSYDQVRIKFYNHPGSGAPVRHLFHLKITDGDDLMQTSEEYDTNDFAPSEWHQIIWNLDQTYYSGTGSNKALDIRMYRYSAVGGGQRLWLDDFGVYKK